MAPKSLLEKRPRDRETLKHSRSPEYLPEVAITVISPSSKQKDIGEFVNFVLSSLERNSLWLNNLLMKYPSFRCALMVGAGPNRFQIQEMIYPTKVKDLKLEVEIQDSEDYDRIGFAALVKLSNNDLSYLLEYVRFHLPDNSMLREDMLAGKAMGFGYAVLKPLFDNQFRISDRLVIDSTCTVVTKRKHKKSEPIPNSYRKVRRVA